MDSSFQTPSKHSYLESLLFGPLTKSKKIGIGLFFLGALLLAGIFFWIGLKGAPSSSTSLYVTPTPEITQDTETPSPVEDTPEDTEAPTRTPSPSKTPTRTPTLTPTNSPTSTPTSTPTNSPTATPTFTPTATPTNTPTHTPTFAPTPTSTESASPTP